MVRLLLAVFVVFGLSGCSTIRSSKLLAPSWFGFTEIAENVYVNEAMPSGQRQDLLAQVNRAKTRVSSFFGGLQSSPEIFACSTEDCFVSSGGVSAKGKAYGASMLLLSPRGLNTVIIAHELTHIELHDRVGAFRSWRSIPPWFDEGLAVLVSEDPRFTEKGWLSATEHGRKAPELSAIGRSAALGQGDWQLTYGTARRAVGKWYAHAGRTGLLRLIAAVKDGEDFDTALNEASSTSVHSRV